MLLYKLPSLSVNRGDSLHTLDGIWSVHGGQEFEEVPVHGLGLL